MPDEGAKLSKDQKAKFSKWLKEKGREVRCPFCQTNSWQIVEHLISGLAHGKGGGLSIGGPSYPQAAIVCKNCAYVCSFMAVPIGLLNGEQQDKDAEPKEKSNG